MTVLKNGTLIEKDAYHVTCNYTVPGIPDIDVIPDGTTYSYLIRPKNIITTMMWRFEDMKVVTPRPRFDLLNTSVQSAMWSGSGGETYPGSLFSTQLTMARVADQTSLLKNFNETDQTWKYLGT